MCSRFSQDLDLELLRAFYALEGSAVSSLEPRYNVAPTQEAAVIVDDGGRGLRRHRFGLIPSWAKDASVGSKLLNARSETVEEKPSFREAFRRRRCVVPADGYYEWKKAGKERKPVRVARPGRELLALAGLWDEWRAPDGARVRTFAILTTEASAALRPLHERMPVLLDREGGRRWLDPAARAEALGALLKPWDGALDLIPVTPKLSKPGYDAPDCAEPFVEGQAHLPGL